MNGFTEVLRLDPVVRDGHRANGKVLRVLSREAGGAGDCFYHSIALLVNILRKNNQVTAADVKREAAARVSEGNVVDLLQDMMCSHCEPHETVAPSAELASRGLFDPAPVWNRLAASGNRSEAAREVRAAIADHTGLYFWNDVDLLGLVEEAYGVHVVAASVNGGTLNTTRSIPGLMRMLADPAKVEGDLTDFKPTLDTVFILNHGNGHWTSMALVCGEDFHASVAPALVASDLGFMFLGGKPM